MRGDLPPVISASLTVRTYWSGNIVSITCYGGLLHTPHGDIRKIPIEFPSTVIRTVPPAVLRAIKPRDYRRSLYLHVVARRKECTARILLSRQGTTGVSVGTGVRKRVTEQPFNYSSSIRFTSVRVSVTTPAYAASGTNREGGKTRERERERDGTRGRRARWPTGNEGKPRDIARGTSHNDYSRGGVFQVAERSCRAAGMTDRSRCVCARIESHTAARER